MNQKEIEELAAANQREAFRILKESSVEDIWGKAGCRVNLVGSLRMGLLMTHRDIDLHVYSSGITIQSSFAIAAKIAANPNVAEIKCINGLHTEEHCVAWHILYNAANHERWQIDMIHIEEDTAYDGYFEHMADRITETMTPEQRLTILRLKFEAPQYHGVEYYEAVMADGVSTVDELHQWVTEHRSKPPYYWIP